MVASPHIEAAAVETSRTPGTLGLANYNVVVKLKADAGQAILDEQLVLVTNDYHRRPPMCRWPSRIDRLPPERVAGLDGRGRAGQLVTPTSWSRPLAVRILTVRSSDARFQCQAPADRFSDHHLLSATFAAAAAGARSPRGRLAASIRIETNLPGRAGRGSRFRPIAPPAAPAP